MEESLDLQPVHPATQRTSECSLTPKVQFAYADSKEIQEFGESFHHEMSEKMPQHL